jgi:hypothetical protein
MLVENRIEQEGTRGSNVLGGEDIANKDLLNIGGLDACALDGSYSVLDHVRLSFQI